MIARNKDVRSGGSRTTGRRQPTLLTALQRLAEFRVALPMLLLARHAGRGLSSRFGADGPNHYAPPL